MNILVVGGTRFFGVPMIEELLRRKHSVTIATRGKTKETFGNSISRVVIDRSKPESVKKVLGGKHYDVIIDKVAYCSNDVKYLLDYVSCDRYILMSTMSVYFKDHAKISEDEFKAEAHTLKWCNREDYDYGEVKRQAECAVCQKYNNQSYTFVRYPIVMGKGDYTNRLKFYVEYIINRQAMYVDDLDKKMSFIHEKEAGEFLAWLVEQPIDGAVNGCSFGEITPGEIISYVESKSGKKVILTENGEEAPYNGCMDDLTLDTSKAESAGYHFSDISDWIYQLLDRYIQDIVNKNGS